MVKELLPIVLACTVWGQEWASSCMCCLCDNLEVVACLRSHTSQDRHCMHMLWTLAFVEARHTFSLQPQYISTTDNHLADDLSRDKLASFLTKVTTATRLPTLLVDLLLDPSLDWTSPCWLLQFSDIFRKASLPLHDERSSPCFVQGTMSPTPFPSLNICCAASLHSWPTKVLPLSHLSPTWQRFVTCNCHSACRTPEDSPPSQS